MAYKRTDLIARRRGYGTPAMSGWMDDLWKASGTTRPVAASTPAPAPAKSSSTWDDIWRSISGGAKSALDFYGQQQRDQALANQNAQMLQVQAQMAAQQQSGISPTTIAIVGVGAVALIVLLMRK